MPIEQVIVITLFCLVFFAVMLWKILKKAWQRADINDMPDHASIEEVEIEEPPLEVLDNKELL